MTPFDCIERDGAEPANHLVSNFDYLNTSGRQEAQRVRELIESWLLQYPEESRAALVGRIQSRHNAHHLSAIFELCLHAMLLARNFEILEVEPVLPNGRTPDFLVQAPNDTRFYLEATLASDSTVTDAGAERRLNEALHAVDSINSPNFFLHLHTLGFPNSPVSQRRIRNSIQRFVDGLDYQAVRQAHQDGERPFPSWEYDRDGLRLIVEAVPKHSPAAGRAIGARMMRGGVVTPHIPIKRAVESKAGHYGELDIPLIVAVNCQEDWAEERDAINALFGTEAVAIAQDGAARWVRNPDGAWMGEHGPVYRRCSAMLFFDRLSAWSIAQRSPTLICNPWAHHTVEQLPLGVAVWKQVENNLLRSNGLGLAEIFNLNENWPEADHDNP